MNDDKTTAEAEQDFKNKVFEVLSKKTDVQIDKDGFIVIPMKKSKKNNPSTTTPP